MTSQRRVVITGLGVVSPIGNDPEALWNSLIQGQSGIDRIQRIKPGGLSTSIGGEARDFTGAIEDYGELEKRQKRDIKKGGKLMCREIEMGVAVAQKALQHAGVTPGVLDPDRTGVIYGCDYIMTEPAEFTNAVARCTDANGVFDYSRWGTDGLGEITPLWLLKYLPNMPASHIAIYNDLRGPNNSITLREAASNLAVGEGFSTIARGSADAIVAGATGTRIHPLRSIHTALQEALADNPDNPAAASRPFDSGRTGQVIGEGAGAVLMEELESANRRNATIYGEVVGHGSSTVVSRKGEADIETALANSIQGALRMAGMTPDQIGHVNAHGLSSLVCDRDEARAISRIFDQDGRKIPVVAPKSYFGNLGAGSGTVEMIASTLALAQPNLFATLNQDQPDPECPVNVVVSHDVEPGTAFVNLNVTPVGQASAVIVRKYAG